MSRPIVLNIKIEDETLQTAVEKAIEGQLLSVIRKAIDDSVKDEISKKVFENKNFVDYVIPTAREEVRKLVRETITYDQIHLKSSIEDMIRQEVKASIQNYLSKILAM